MKNNKNNRNCTEFPYRRNTLIKTKILTRFQVYILSSSHFIAISNICLLYSAFTIKSLSCEDRLSKEKIAINKLSPNLNGNEGHYISPIFDPVPSKYCADIGSRPADVTTRATPNGQGNAEKLRKEVEHLSEHVPNDK